jgi:predicted amidophosphoribosyltransferase
MGEKKCPNCGQWSKWTTNYKDICEHCGHPLGGSDLAYQEIRERDTKANEEQWMFYIKEDDSEWVKTWKKIGNFFYTIYIAILTFLAWVIAALPG